MPFLKMNVLNVFEEAWQMDMERLGLCNLDAAVFEKHSSTGKISSPMFSANLCSVEPS